MIYCQSFKSYIYSKFCGLGNALKPFPFLLLYGKWLLQILIFVLNVIPRGLCILYHICVFVSSIRPRGAPPEWGLLGSCEPYWSPGLLWWRKTCCRDNVLCLHETGKGEIHPCITACHCVAAGFLYFIFYLSRSQGVLTE